MSGGSATSAVSAYARSGVDLDASEATKEGIRALVESTRTDLVHAGFGAFGGAFAIPPGYREPLLVASVDGVGTKLHLAIEWGRPAGAGRDLVNHCIDDIGVLAATPVAFLDYVAGDRLEAPTVRALVAGMADACRDAGVAIIGGETAQMPGTYRDGRYDLAGCMIGVVERSDLPDPSRVVAGDVLIGLPSLGLHTNGYSLARRVADALGPDHRVGDGTLADALLAPHPSYLAELRAAYAIDGVRIAAHITGGGLEGNLPRVLPDTLAAVVEVGAWPVPRVFGFIAEQADVAEDEMYRVYNMGLGLVLVVAAEASAAVLDAVAGARIVGRVVERTGAAVILARA
jgi:phosphoribosylformylglycinamidine cyclo-ligase